MNFIEIIAAELGLAVLLLTVLVAAEVYNNIEFRKHQSNGGMPKFVEMISGPPPGLKGSDSEGEEGEREGSGGNFL